MWSLADAASPGWSLAEAACPSPMLGQALSEGEGHAAVIARWQMLGQAPMAREVVLALRQKHRDAREALLSAADPSACTMGADSDAAVVSGGERKKSTVGVQVGSSHLKLGIVSMVLPGGPAYKKIKKGEGEPCVARHVGRNPSAAPWPMTTMMIVICIDLTARAVACRRGCDTEPRRYHRHRGKPRSPPHRSAPRHALLTPPSSVTHCSCVFMMVTPCGAGRKRRGRFDCEGWHQGLRAAGAKVCSVVQRRRKGWQPDRSCTRLCGRLRFVAVTSDWCRR